MRINEVVRNAREITEMHSVRIRLSLAVSNTPTTTYIYLVHYLRDLITDIWWPSGRCFCFNKGQLFAETVFNVKARLV